MSKHQDINLSRDERSQLDSLIRSGRSLARVITKARILLLTDVSQGQGHQNNEIVSALGTSICTVLRTRKTYLESGLDAALYDKPRPGQKPKITGEVEATLTMLACSDPPDGASRWTLQLLADRLVQLELVDGISAVAVFKRLKKMNLSLGTSRPGA
jgi:transposase